jgi:hypothetical protein
MICFKFSHAALDTANGVIYVAGQVAFDKDHNIVGGEDFGTQARQVPANWRTVLDGKGRSRVARPRHLILHRISPAGAVEVGRVLHDAIELERHAPFEFPLEA